MYICKSIFRVKIWFTSQIVIHTIDIQKIQGKGTYQGRRNRGQVGNLGVLCLCPLPHFLTEFSEIADCLASKQK
jgi:hypothetical protein